MKFIQRLMGAFRKDGWNGGSEPEASAAASPGGGEFAKKRAELEAKGLSTLEDLEALVWPLMKDATEIELAPASRPPENSQLRSHFGGDPYFEEGESWPTVDRKPLAFVFQVVDRGGQVLPEGMRVVQFFYDFEAFPWSTEQKGWLVKTYPEVREDRVKRIERPGELMRPKYCEVSMNRVASLPDWEGVDWVSKDASDLSCVLDEEEPWESYRRLAEKLAGEQDYRSQIGGYPKWVQGDETPVDADGNRLPLLFQIDSEDNAGLMWGDAGLIYVFHNPKAPGWFGFTLQCH